MSPRQGADLAALELLALGEHFKACRAASGRLFGMHCLVQALHGLLAPRLISTVAVLVALAWPWL